ncbi:MAG1140 family protein [[Mycoplasma] mobile]|uniref:Uncharacterized protein n=1 Tax=Mycoplasma mobile (strain ATCC 43663 / 163K / NCTC 11711) TaxID=267748 RepID=Q6KHU3_MYCM1|nr:hypothetical protein [[Mycoplasma] mobile]AAT27835.1 hypothetical protein MMOB3490 [Mycoplasma mobile 163K]
MKKSRISFFVLLIFILLISLITTYFFLTFNLRKVIITTVNIDNQKIEAIISNDNLNFLDSSKNIYLNINNNWYEITFFEMKKINESFFVASFFSKQDFNFIQINNLNTFLKIDNIPLYEHLINFI